MKSKIALSLGVAALLGLGAALPASAATTAKPAAAKTTHYYVSLDAKGKGCEVVSVKPTAKLMVGKHAYKTEADANKAMAAAKACKA